MDDAVQTSAKTALLAMEPAREYLGGISLWTLKNLVANGSIRSITIGRRRLIPKDELDRYIAERLAIAS